MARSSSLVVVIGGHTYRARRLVLYRVAAGRRAWARRIESRQVAMVRPPSGDEKVVGRRGTG